MVGTADHTRMAWSSISWATRAASDRPSVKTSVLPPTIGIISC